MIIDYFSTHIYAFWFVAGFLLLALEILVFGFSTGVALFLGLASLSTGGLIWFELLPATWTAGIASFSISSVVISALLWKPFKNLEKKGAPVGRDNSSDIIGHEFRLQETISAIKPGKTRFSGIEWVTWGISTRKTVFGFAAENPIAC